MIIRINTTDPLDAGPVNLYSIWDILNYGRMTQRIFINVAMSGYWKVDKTGAMNKIIPLGSGIPDITFTLDMRKIDRSTLRYIYQKWQNGQAKQKIRYSISGGKTSIEIISTKPKLITPKNTILTLVQS